MLQSRLFRYTPEQVSAFAVMRIVFGVIWAINTVLQANTPYVNGFLASIVERIKGQPDIIRTYLHGVVHVVNLLGPHYVAVGTVVLDALLALSLLTGVAYRPMAWLGVVYTLLLWSTVGGFGGSYVAGATDPGTAIVYALVFFAVLSVPAGQRFTVGGYRGPAVDVRRIEIVRVLFGLLWAFDAFWKWQPAFLKNCLSYLTSSQAGQPVWIVKYIGVFIRFFTFVGPLHFGILAAAVETMIAVGLLANLGQKWLLPVGFLYSFGLWTTAEGWGGPYALGSTGNRGDMLGTANIYMVVYLFLMVAYLYRRERQSPQG
ncbi:MAG: hypothetical protein ACYDHM_04695 [Acidiferrobacterales bacterium]